MQMSVCIKIDMKQNIAHFIMALFISQRPDQGTVNIGLYLDESIALHTTTFVFFPHFVMADNEPYLHLWYQYSKCPICSLNNIFKIYYYAFFISNITFGLLICALTRQKQNVNYRSL